mmetsp:Transcript_21384/g.48360  ORF Transcript_21384/g.48360 Transcript_21384/m.48360 type:complete len:87 (+) Transcript_21384:3177-3437(+)
MATCAGRACSSNRLESGELAPVRGRERKLIRSIQTSSYANGFLISSFLRFLIPNLNRREVVTSADPEDKRAKKDELCGGNNLDVTS